MIFKFHFLRNLYENTLSTQFSLILHFNSSHTPSFIPKFKISSLNIMVMRMYLCVYASLYNLQSPVSVSLIYVCPGLSTWHWTTFVRVPLKERDSPFLTAQLQPIALHLEVGLSRISCQLGVIMLALDY